MSATKFEARPFYCRVPAAEALGWDLARWNRRRVAVHVPTPGWEAETLNDHGICLREGAIVAPLFAYFSNLAPEFIGGLSH